MHGQAPPAATRQLLAVIYAFEVWEGGERRLVTEEGISASTLSMLQPQLHAVAKRTRVDQGPGLLVFADYKDARMAAQTVATIATHVVLREVAPADGAGGEGWVGQGGARYVAVPGGVSQVVRG